MKRITKFLSSTLGLIALLGLSGCNNETTCNPIENEKEDLHEIYKISKEDFDNFYGIKEEKYLQISGFFGFSFSYSSIFQNVFFKKQYAPNISYSYNLASYYGANYFSIGEIVCKPEEGSNLIYNYTDSHDGNGYQRADIPTDSIPTPQSDILNILRTVAGQGTAFNLTYDMIENKFCEATNSYLFNLTINEFTYDMEVSFFMNKIVNFKAQGVKGNTDIKFGSVSFTYETVTPEFDF